MTIHNEEGDTAMDTQTNQPDYRESVAKDPFAGDEIDLPLWSEILPNLWQGGTADNDKVGDRSVKYSIPAITARDFNSVYTFYAFANPVDWMVKEYRFGYYDSPDTDFPIAEFKRIVKMAHDDWKRGEKVLIRCQAGLNRSGIITALVLIRDGYTAREAIDLMRETRHEYVLFNKHFEQWLLKQPVEFWRD
jgi:protein-tyrosine phosphatase